MKNKSIKLVIFLISLIILLMSTVTCNAYESEEKENIEAVEEKELIAGKYTLEEVMLLAYTTYAEAGGCSDEHQMYVVSVILNRVNDKDFPDSIEEVVYQKEPTLQYSCTENGAIEYIKNKYDGNCNDYEFLCLERTFENVLYILEVGSLLPENVVYQAQFEQGSGVYEKIGNTYFCYK